MFLKQLIALMFICTAAYLHGMDGNNNKQSQLSEYDQNKILFAERLRWLERHPISDYKPEEWRALYNKFMASQKWPLAKK